MAQILKGKHKGELIPIHQWSNDWFSLEDGTILSPLSLRLTDEEQSRVRETFERGTAGTMPSEFDLNLDGTFKKKAR